MHVSASFPAIFSVVGILVNLVYIDQNNKSVIIDLMITDAIARLSAMSSDSVNVETLYSDNQLAPAVHATIDMGTRLSHVL